MAVVVFDPSVFLARYRAFISVDATLLTAYFNEACLYCDNTDGSLIDDITARTTILNMITAHIAELDTTPLVGRVGDLVVGGINTHLAYAPAVGSRAWFDQTRYGAAAWAAMSPYRCALYVPPCSDL